MKRRNPAKRRLVAALLGTALLASVALAPSVAVPGTSAHEYGYIGYGCSGWDTVRYFPPLLARDCYAWQQMGCSLLMRHEYSGFFAPGTYYSWRSAC